MNTAAVVEKCFQAGKHVISEKPVAGTHDAAVKLLHQYRTQFQPEGLIWAVNENWAFEPNFLRVRVSILFTYLIILTMGQTKSCH
jgi:predicted dehydrogenase